MSDRHLQQDLALPPVLDAQSMRSHADAAARLLGAIANPHRLIILYTLCSGEISVGTLNETLTLSQSALSQHLSVLRRERLVQTRRKSQTIYYSLSQGIGARLIDLIYTHYNPSETRR